MFIALQHQHLPRSSGAPCAVMRSVYMPLLTERDILEIRGYKHVAPTEQEPSIPMMNTFRAKLNRLEIKLLHYRQLRWTTVS
jgi:hypothetical protein